MTIKCGFIRMDRDPNETVAFYMRRGLTKEEAISKTKADLKHMGDKEIEKVVSYG